MSFADRIIAFNEQLIYTGAALPGGIRIMNPFQESPEALEISRRFYEKYYNDEKKRYLILGINPGRFGAGLTGIPFTDPKRLIADCNIPYTGKITHEPSSVFVYEAIKAFGSVKAFYKKFHINSLCPLGFTAIDDKGKEKNYNYYDSNALSETVHDFIIDNIRKQIELGIYTDTCICFGTGKNESYFRKINEEHGFFKQIIPLEHPRFIMQYKAKNMGLYIDKYVNTFNTIGKTKSAKK